MCSFLKCHLNSCFWVIFSLFDRVKQCFLDYDFYKLTGCHASENYFLL
eukprot:UN17995